MIWFTLSDQTVYFLWSLVLGLVLGALYDVLRAVRMVTKARGAGVVASDTVFFGLCGVITSLFALPFNKGDVRAFIIFGEAVGFLVYRFTLGNVMGRVYSRISGILRAICKNIRKVLEKIFNLLLKGMAFVLYNVTVIIERLHNNAEKRKNIRKETARQKRKSRLCKHKDKHNEQKIRKDKNFNKNNRR